MSETFITIQSGRIDNKVSFMKFLNGLKDGRYRVVFNAASKRTPNQNAWLHSVLPDIMRGLQEAGYYEIRTLEMTKAFVKELFFKVPVSNGSETVDIVQPTSETNKVDFTDRAEAIIIWASEYLGIDIAPPNTQVKIFK